MIEAVLVGIGGAIGANARFLLSTWFARRYGSRFPYGTLFINLSGSFLFGLLAVFVTPEWRLLLIVGFLGGYTTFSTFAYETLTLVREAATLRAAINSAASAGGGILAAVAGLALGNLFVH